VGGQPGGQLVETNKRQILLSEYGIWGDGTKSLVGGY